MAASALLVSFASCSSNDEGGDVDKSGNAVGTMDVALTVSNDPSATVDETYGIATESPKGKKPMIQSGVTGSTLNGNMKVFFVKRNPDGTGTIRDKRNASDDILATSQETKQVFKGIPNDVNEVYFFANIGDNTPAEPNNAGKPTNLDNLDDTNTLADLLKVQFELGSQQDPINRVHVFGKAQITGSNGSVSASVVAKPVIARLEIKQLEADQSVSDAAIKITDYRVEGIFINNTYSSMGIDGTSYPVDPSSVVNVPVDGRFDETYGPKSLRIWYHDLGGMPFEPSNGVLKAENIAGQPAGSFWYFDVFPALAKNVSGNYIGTTIPAGTLPTGETVAADEKNATPIIVLRLSNIQVNGVALPSAYPSDNGVRYVTVKTLKKAGTNVPYDHLERGMVYTIKNIKFDGSNLNIAPNITVNKDLSVDVDVRAWDGEESEAGV